ncbi:MAG: GNAT family N-acetyltransferase [Oligoflexales bacterium]
MVRKRTDIQKNPSQTIHRYLGDNRERHDLQNMTQQPEWGFWKAEEIEKVFQQHHGILFYMPNTQTDASPWAGLVFAQSSVDTSELLYIYTPKSQRSQGFARQGLLHLIEHLKATGNQDALFLEVRPSNTHAIALYESLGWQKTHKRNRYYQDGEDALVYKLKLTK